MSDTPATPGQAAPTQEPSQPATPGTSPAKDQQPPSAPPAQQPPSEGQVTISAKEYAQLQRDKARLKSAQRRSSRSTDKQADPNDPSYDENEAVAQERNKRVELEQQLFQRDVKDRTRELLDKEDFKDLPESTRKLILRNPHALSEAQDLDEVILDIEDFLREETAAIKATGAAQPPAPSGDQPPSGDGQPPAPQGHDTPPKVGAGSPQAPPANQLEDVSNLTGTERSRAVLRNKLKQARGIKA